MGSGSSRIGSGQSSEPSRLNRTKDKLSSLLLCGLTSDSNSHPSVLELESPINSVENLPPTSIESTSSTGLSSSICASSKTSVTEHEESESCNTSYESQPIQESGNESDPPFAFDSQSTVNDVTPVSASNNVIQETPDFDVNSNHNRSDITRDVDSDARALLVLSDSYLSLRMFGSRLTSSGSGIVVVSGGDSVINSREGRTNSGRVFRASSSRRSYRRDVDFPGLFLTTGLVDDLGSRDRWVIDVSDDIGHDVHTHGYHRSHGMRRHFRSQMSERRLRDDNEREHRTRLCSSGMHLDGACSCGSSFMGEEVASLGSISRVVLLAQALSEVLDEMHRQPLSLSMPMLSLPAPESVVDSFLLKNYKRMNASESGPNYVQQCYICLVDYEEGDQIRVLPCQHEYHAVCVDKWLKEVNGVCPVCRCNVCDAPATSQATISSSELQA